MRISFRFKAKLILAVYSAVLAAVIAFSATVASAAPQLRVLRGAGQQTTYGSAFPVPLTVWVVDSATSRPIAGVRVNFLPGRGIGLSPSYAITNEKGLASVTATGLEACTSTASAELAGAHGSRVDFDDLQVAKAPLTVLPDDIESPAGSELPIVANYSFVGFVNGDTADSAHITGAPTLTTTATDSGMRANYAIKGGAGTLSSPNYTFVPGFGTLAIVGTSQPDGWVVGQMPDKALVAPPEEPTAGVRPALSSQRATSSLLQPAFIAGLRGESGIFVRAAIWPQPAASSAVSSANTRSAMLVVAMADLPVLPAAPVRAVPLPRVASAGSSTAAALPTRAAVTAVPLVSGASEPPANTAPVRAIMLPPQNKAASPSSVFSGSSIRKAFATPASK